MVTNERSRRLLVAAVSVLVTCSVVAIALSMAAQLTALSVVLVVVGVGAALLVVGINRNYRDQSRSLTAMKDVNAKLEELVAERTAAQRQAQREAEKASEAKSRFLAAAAHDLRQPLQALMMFIDELGYRPLGQVEQEIVGKVEASAKSLSNLLNALLDISAIDSGAIEPRIGVLPLSSVLAAVEARFRAPAEAAGLGFTMVPSSVFVHSDPVLLVRILSNLVSNAVRYTEAGRVLVGCRRCGDEVLLQVVDTGIGIAPEQLPLVFEEYYQIANPGRDRRNGTGLGLAIVRRLATLLGHTVEVASQPGRGSMFTLRLAMAECPVAEKRGAGVEPATDGAGALVVIIDDDAEVRRSVAGSLKNRRYAVLPAASGREALDLLRWVGRPPAAVVADYRLAGEETGLDAIAAIHALNPEAKTVAVVLTGEQRFDRVVPDGVVLLRKPVPPVTLCATIERLRAAATS